ncbi:MAG TPA: class I SAM-dependent methyltransferase [Candidatus Saccharimonadales bacterium]|nr:class I SAM-dependent methyltransferase [Candidatus Saccharimonadales bacterium]
MVPEYHQGLMIYGEHVARYEAVKDLVTNKTVLDIACGSGYGSSILARKAKKIIGVDSDKKTIAYALEKYGLKNIEFLVGDANRIPIKDNAVDMVVSFETIEHVSDFKKFLREMKRVLKDDGLLVISTPNQGVYIEDNPFHQHQFIYNEFMTLLKSNFRTVRPYFQSTWLYNSILSKDLLNKKWIKEITTLFTVESSPKKAVYFVILCSDKPVPTFKPIGAVSQPWSAKQELMHAKELERVNKLTKEHIVNLENTILFLDKELRLIKQSFLYKIFKPLIKIKRSRAS